MEKTVRRVGPGRPRAQRNDLWPSQERDLHVTREGTTFYMCTREWGTSMPRRASSGPTTIGHRLLLRAAR